jgi:predicted HicB family RNase H-like nuclease
MPRPYTEKRAAANKKWDAANLDRISIAAPKGTRDALKRAADAAGQSVNQFIIDKLAPWIAAPSPDAAPDQTEKAPE